MNSSDRDDLLTEAIDIIRTILEDDRYDMEVLYQRSMAAVAAFDDIEDVEVRRD